MNHKINIMGHLNDHDLVNTHVITCSRLGLDRKTHMFRTGHYLRSIRGDMRGYSLWIRTTTIKFLDTHGSYTRSTICVGCLLQILFVVGSAELRHI